MKITAFALIFFCFLTTFSWGGGSSDKSSTPAASTVPQQPEWVRDPYTVRNRQTYIAAVGSGATRQAAEAAALGNLVGLFGQSIMVDERISTSYQEMQRSGAAAQWSNTVTADSTIATSAGLNTLVGAEIGEAWVDSSGTHYTIAFLNRARTIATYTEMVRANQEAINNLTNLSAAQRNTLEGFARINLAATLADINVSYGYVVSECGNPALLQSIRRGDEYRLEANEIARQIPVRIAVTSGRELDIGNRIQDAFSGAISSLQLRTVTEAAPYTLEISITMTDEAGGQNIFARYTVSANFIDSRTRQSIIPVYNFQVREGHLDLPRAQTRVITTVERIINNGDSSRNMPAYSVHLDSNIQQMLVRR